MTYAEILIKKGKRGAAAFVQAECMSAKSAASSSTQSPDVLQTPAHLQVIPAIYPVKIFLIFKKITYIL